MRPPRGHLATPVTPRAAYRRLPHAPAQRACLRHAPSPAADARTAHRRHLARPLAGLPSSPRATLLAPPSSRWTVVVQLGIILSSLGAGLQSLTGAPRLLQAIANDNLMPVLTPFRGAGEPRRALGLVFTLCALFISTGDIDTVAPIITMFFLICYMFVNLACLLQDVLQEPNWRPRFHFYHPLTSLAGFGLCVFIMFFTAPLPAVGAILIVGLLYAYISIKKVESQWGDGLRGLRFEGARRALQDLETLSGGTHTRNWRPQVRARAHSWRGHPRPPPRTALAPPPRRPRAPAASRQHARRRCS